MIGGRNWTGGYNYLLNLVRAIDSYAADRVLPLLFVGNDVSEEDVAPFRDVQIMEVVRSAVFDAGQSHVRLLQAALLGIDYAAAKSFAARGVDVVFEPAMFYGWRFPIPTIAWLPDFQHRHLPELFGAKAYWKRELGFKAQLASGRLIMLSSEDARADCERFYPSSTGRTAVVRFAVPPDSESMQIDPMQVVREYGLPEHFFYLPNQIWKHKNHRVVIEALQLLKQRGHDVVVAVSGKAVDPRHPDHYDTLKSLIAAHGLIDNFRFLGMVPRQHVVALMRACTALINPSLFEGWSTTVEEAKSLGVPMLLSNLRVHREQVGDAAVFFDADSAQQLATLMAAHQNLPASSRQDMEKSAILASQNRMRQFAIDFSETVERAVTQSCTMEIRRQSR